jgi:HSP20 family molecular chaperone IbpA
MAPNTGTSRRFDPKYLIRRDDRSLSNVAKVVSHSDGRHVVVQIELAGIDPDADVRLEVRDQVLEIEVHHVDDGGSERVSHQVSIPAGVTRDDLRLTLTGDVLEIRADAP